MEKSKWEQAKDGSWYYVNEDGKMARNAWAQDKDGFYYYLDADGKMTSNQWRNVNGQWYYMDQDGKMQANTWKNDEGKWYYFDKDGHMVLDDWVKDKDEYYYINSKGEMEKNIWIHDGEKSYYLDGSGAMLVGWQEINGEEYFLDYSTGEKKTGFIKDGEGGLYYLDDDTGAVTTGWRRKDDGTWYYFGGNEGQSITGWIKDGNGHYYLTPEGKIEKGWKEENNKWYYLDDETGKMATGWKEYGDSLYYFNSAGDMKTGWLEENGNWYYLDSDGEMQTGVIEYDGKEYNLGTDGKLEYTEDSDDTEIITTKTELEQKVEEAAKLRADFLETGSISSLGKLIATNWQIRIGSYTNYNETIMIAHGIDPELAKAGAEVITGELCGQFLGVTINGVKAFVNIRTGEVVYDGSVVAGSGGANIGKGVEAGEQVLSSVSSYEQARNKALEIVGDLGADSEPYVGRLGTGEGKIVGRQSADGKVRWRLDYDPEKGPHINVEDYRNGKGPNATKIAIPFEGDISSVESVLNYLNN
jgi:glucan-binding YG repeat protein